MRREEILDLAKSHGLELGNDMIVNEMGIDFKVVFATDVGGTEWVLRIPRREGLAPQIEQEKRILDLVSTCLPVSVPDWKIATPSLIAYPLLENKPALVSNSETGELTWNIDQDNSRFVASLAKVLVGLHRIPVQQVESMGVKSSPPDRVRQELWQNIEHVKCELGIAAELETRWRTWVEDDRGWPNLSSFIHGDLYAGHILVDETGEISGIIDWSEGQVGDPAADFAGHAAVFGEQGLRDLIGLYERFGGVVWDRLFEHTMERVAASPLIYAIFAIKTGMDEHIDAAKEMLGSP